MAAALCVEDVSKVYRIYARPQDRLKEMVFGRAGRRFSRDFWALHDVSFTLEPGERLGVIGRNGSGKSTLLQILAGTLAPTAGRIEIEGRVAALLELGSGFNPDYTGRENVYLNASILGLSRDQIDARFDDIAAFADIGEFLDQPVKTYSSGMFVRLAFSVITSVDADLLLIDEALAVGDVFFTQKCFRHLHTLIDRGVAIVLVSHDTTAVSQFCSSVLLLDHGRARFRGDTVTGVRTYFALQRSGHASLAASSAAADRGLDDGGADLAAGETIVDWPAPEAFLPLDRIVPIGEDGARCTAIALCDEQGQPARLFQIGEAALFFFEFTLDEAIEMPSVGVELFNERGLVLHGKNSVQWNTPTPRRVGAGARVRGRHRIVLDLAPGEYTFALGLASVDPEAATLREVMDYTLLASRMRTVLVVKDAGAFAVRLRSDGQALPFHGLCDLDGDAQVQVIETTGRAPTLVDNPRPPRGLAGHS